MIFLTIATLLLHICTTLEEKSKGLMDTPYLAPNEGMLFSYEEPKQASFWMFHCLIDLSIAFIDEQGVVREVHEMRAYPHVTDPRFFHEKAIFSKGKIKYAIEANKGWFTAHGIEEGSHCRIEEQKASFF